MKRSIESQRRGCDRVAVDIPIFVSMSRTTQGKLECARTVDISSSGMSFTCAGSFIPRNAVTISVGDDNGSGLTRPIKSIEARIVRRSASLTDKHLIIGTRFKNPKVTSLVVVEILRLQTRKSHALLRVVSAMDPTKDFDINLQELSTTAAAALNAEIVHLFLPNGNNQLCARETASGSTYPLRCARGLLSYAATQGTAARIQSPSSHPLFVPESDTPLDENTHSILCIPIHMGSTRPSGMLLAVNSKWGCFTWEDESVGNAVCKLLSRVLSEINLLEQNRALQVFHERLLSDLPVAVAHINSLGCLTFANRVAGNVLGLDVLKDIGKPLNEVVHPHDNSKLLSVLGSVAARPRRKSVYDIRFLSANKTSSSLNLHLIPTDHNCTSGTLLIAEDITKEQRFISTLNRYLAREVTERLVSSGTADHLGGSKLAASILIADIRNFTQLAERMDPSALMKLLNEYFTPMINVIFRHQGMVDKFMGDALLAVFGPPSPRSDDALRAARAALEMQKELTHINKRIEEHWGTRLEAGIGLTSGTVISGNIGSERRMDYTVIGEPVNLAARLEGLTKDVKRRVLINESVYQQIKGSIQCEPLGRFDVRGKTGKIEVYALC